MVGIWVLTVKLFQFLFVLMKNRNLNKGADRLATCNLRLARGLNRMGFLGRGRREACGGDVGGLGDP